MATGSVWVRVSVPAAAVLGLAIVVGGCGGSMPVAVTPPTPPPTAPPTTPPPTPASCTTPAATITHSAGVVNAPQLIVLDATMYPAAKCNDGSSAAYVLREGVGAAANRWIVSLHGGGECYDQPTCASRAATMPTLVSSSPYQANPSLALDLGGLLSPDASSNPDFYDASTVQILYCSSDDWSGAKASASAYSANDPTTWNFEGHAILSSVIADLSANHGLSSATEVMLTGQSAGGVGTFANVNSVAKLLPSAVRFVAYSDAAFGNVIDNFSATGAPPDYLDTTSTPNEIAKRVPGIALWNGTGDAACAAAATTPTAQVGCYSGQQLLASGGGIALPMLVSVAEKDTNQLGTDGVSTGDIGSGNLTAAESGYISYFASQMRYNLGTTNASVSIFSPDIFAHVEATDPVLFVTPQTFPAGSLTLQQAVGSWYKTPCSAQRNIAD